MSSVLGRAGAVPALITSPNNRLVKDLVRLGRRSAADRFLIEGYRELRRALDASVAVEALFSCPSLFLGSNENAVLQDAQRAGAAMIELSDAAFRKVSQRDRPEGLLGLARRHRLRLQSQILPRAPLVLVANAVQTPGNLGAMFRTAAAAGVDLVLVSDPVTDPLGPNAIRASLGAVFVVPFVACASDDALAWLVERGIAVVATTPQESASPHWSAELTGPVAVVIGSEQSGLPARWIRAADVRVRVPMPGGGADSLNAAAATAVVLFEVVRQRAGSPPVP